MSNGAEEIIEKMTAQHQAGAHQTGPQAGCPLCAQQLAAIGGGISGEGPAELPAQGALHELAAARARREAETAAAAPKRTAVPSVGEIRSWSGERTLGDVALQDAQQALDDLEALAMASIVIPNERQALVHAQVGIVRALAGVEEQLAQIAGSIAQLVAIVADEGEEITVLEPNVHGDDGVLPVAPLSEDDPPPAA